MKMWPQNVPHPALLSNRKVYWVIILALLGIHLFIPMTFSETSVGYDGSQYLQYAENLLRYHQFTYDGVQPSSGRSPGYPAFLAGFLYVFGDIELVYPVQLILLFGVYFIVALMTKNILPAWWRIGLMAALVACWPLTKMSMRIQTETLFIFLTTSSIYFLIQFLKCRARRWMLAFIILSTLSAFVRPITMIFVPISVIILLCFRHIGWRRAVIMIIVWAAILTPWTYRNWRVFERFIPMASGYGSIYYMTDQEAFETIMLKSASSSHRMPVYQDIVGNDSELEIKANEKYLARARQNIKRDPIGFFRRCALKTIFVWTYLPSTKIYLERKPIVFFGGVFVQLLFLITTFYGAILLKKKYRPLVLAAALLAGYHVLALFPFYAESRFLVPVYLIFTAPAAYALFHFYSVIRSRKRQMQHVAPNE